MKGVKYYLCSPFWKKGVKLEGFSSFKFRDFERFINTLILYWDQTFIEQMEIDSGPGITRWRVISSRFFKELEVVRWRARTREIDEAKDK